MANTGLTNISNLDVSTYRDSLENYLKNQSQFKDYIYEGSNLSVELDLLAFNTYQNAFLLNMVGAEMFQDTAVLRESAVSHAKELNYIPRSRTSAASLVNVTVAPPDSPSIVVIPKFYSFVSQSQFTGRSYIFSTNEPIVIRANGGNYIANNVQIYEGRVVSEYFVANSSLRYVISSANVDISSIDVNVQASSFDTSNTTYTFSENLYGLNANSSVYFLQGYGTEQYELVFGNNITGKALQDGNIVKVTYRDCSADEGNGINRFQPASTISGYTNIAVSTVGNVRSSGGAERESIESIKFNAPRHYATQGRAINNSDYETVIRQQFPIVESLSVFGGEELPQKQYGKVAISAKPFGGQALTQAIKNSITAYISEINSIEIVPIYIDPEYFYFEVNSDVYYDLNATSKTTTELTSSVLSSIADYSTNSLSDFRNNFYLSRLSNVINNADGSIRTNQTSTRLIKRKAPLLNVGQTININFGTSLLTIMAGYRALQSSTFTYTVGSTDYNAYYGDDGAGNLNIYTTDANNREVVLLANAGTVNYATGNVTTIPVIYTSYNGYIAFYARTVSKDFTITRNQILLIDPSDVNINLYKV